MYEHRRALGRRRLHDNGRCERMSGAAPDDDYDGVDDEMEPDGDDEGDES